MRRRAMLAGGLALAAATRAVAAPAPGGVLPLWPGRPPGEGAGPADPGGDGFRAENGRHGDVAVQVARPSLQVIRPARPTGTAALVCAGGGYRRIETGNESVPAAEWLAARGVTAYVLRYRLPDEGWAATAPLQDAQRALRLIQAQPGIQRLGVLGFSSGGHLAGLAAARGRQLAYTPVDAADAAPVALAFAGLIYPVISLLPPNAHTSTRRQLAGDDPAAAEAFSVQRQVTPAMPPTFLAQAIDDPVSPIDNSLLMLAACRAAGVKVEAHLFQAGGHGWGLGHGETAAWPALFAAWLGLGGVPLAQP